MVFRWLVYGTMADLLYSDSDLYGGADADDYESDSGNGDTDLGPLERLDKYIICENSYERQMIARSLPETIQQVIELSLEIQKLLDAIVKLSDDTDDTIRVELMEQFVAVAEQCQRYAQLAEFNPVSTCLLPIIVKYLADHSIQVRKATHITLLRLADQCLTHDDIESQIVPVLYRLAEQDSLDDFRTESIMLMAKLAVIVGKDMAERLFLPRFAQMCTDALFHVRKVCASNFGEMCQIVGQQNTETHLLPKFYYLCEDGVWGVRNACAECFVQVSMVCSLQVRRSDLTQLFIDLICDQSRWVRLAAFQSLGAFIATFADPSLTGLSLTADGHVVYTEPCHSEVESDCQSVVNDNKLIDSTDTNTADSQLTNSESFNSFQFWRVAPPVVDEQIVVTVDGDIRSPSLQKSQYNTFNGMETTTTSTTDSCQLNVSEFDSTVNESIVVSQQTIVPQELLNHYLSMIEPARAQTVDSEIMRHCAFNFPAIAFTLGRSNWSCLSNLYNVLARDMQWKVRRTLAFSIHEVAVILGEELTSSQLVPIFDEFLKDLDEVRVGILKHLSDFLRLLKPDQRRVYLTKFPEFLKTDNSRNWRLRLDLAQQLVPLVDLYTATDVYEFLLPIALSLTDDSVAEVRFAAVKVLSSTLRQMKSNDVLLNQLIIELKQRFIEHHLSSHRQMFLRLCIQVLVDNAVTDNMFITHFLSAALATSTDTVANTRILLARLLAHLLSSPVYNTQHNALLDRVTSVVSQLAADKDRDVQYIINNRTGL